MRPQMILRQPSNPVVKGITSSVICIVLLWAYRSGLSSLAADLPPQSRIVDDVFNSTLGFEKIFVVSLPERTDRRDGMVLSAALSDIEVEFVDGVKGESVADKAIPSSPGHDRLRDGLIGCWRGHMNAIQEIVRRNLSSALILEDDADWDVRLKEQLRDFALSAHALTQPLSNSPSSYADPTYPLPANTAPGIPPDLFFDQLPSTVEPKISPYGDNWDFIWLGHCAMRFPVPDSYYIPRARVVHTDHTVPEKQHLTNMYLPYDLIDQYPHHTRVVHHAQTGVCALGYAVSQAGARKLLHAIGLQDVSAEFDLIMRYFCDGWGGKYRRSCLTMQPALFYHHRPAGSLIAESDISDRENGYRETAETAVVRWSVRMNWENLLDGKTDFTDQYPDTE